MRLDGSGPFGGITDMVARIPPLHRVVVGAALVTVAIAALVLGRSSGETDMSPLFTDLGAADASAVVDALESRGVPHSLTDGGNTVMVPTADVYDLRVALAGEGLPESNEGYALLDQHGITTSEFSQRIDYQRALEGEISRTLRAMDGVDAATVHLALPDDSLFAEDAAPVTASVMLTPRTGQGFGPDAVQAVVHLVAASVKDLDAADVTVVDAAGAVLAGPSMDSGVGAATTRARAEEAYSRSLEASITAMLARVTGPDHVAVSVHATLDLDRTNTTSERYGKEPDPETGRRAPGEVASESESTETYTGAGGGGTTGVLGPDGSVQTPAGAEISDEYDKEDTTRTYDVDRVVQVTEGAPGEVTSLSVSVLVDSAVVTDTAALRSIETAVRAATGIGEASETEQLEVVPMEFVTTEPVVAEDLGAAEAAAAADAERMEMLKTAAILVVVVMALVLGASSARRARRVVATPLSPDALALSATPVVATIATHDAAPVPAGVMTAGPGPAAEMPVALPTQALPVARPADGVALERNEVVAFAQQNPSEAANVLRNWLVEDRESGRR